MNIIEKAIQFAAKAHEGACRKGTSLPYIIHPMEAASIVAQIQQGPMDAVLPQSPPQPIDGVPLGDAAQVDPLPRMPQHDRSGVLVQQYIMPVHKP